MPAELIAENAQPTVDDNIALYFAATAGQEEYAPIRQAIADAQSGILFAMFTPGNSPLLDDLLGRAKENKIYVRGVVSRVVTKSGIVEVGGTVIKEGQNPSDFHKDVLIPSGITERSKPSWAEAEFTAEEMLAHHMMAIVHSKVIVIDPLGDDCVVITGSHNFSPAASSKNDENLVIVRGNKRLAQAYALHLKGVYDHYSWRAYVGNGGDPNVVYKPLTGWQPGGARAAELAFWMR
jgi:phosphatidylserine/phosphatidylglycerophosphate/cardiolipin synthase-like enzyme